MTDYPEITDYKLLSKSGGGAYGCVYLAIRKKNGEHVALKIIPKTQHSSKEFEGLKYYCSRCPDSPNLLTIHHACEEKSYYYYTMELADNAGSMNEYHPETLARKLLSQGRMSPLNVIRLGMELLNGLAIIHKAGLLHRDIKPENVIYVDGTPKLSDIGLVSVSSSKKGLHGTLGFIPPEKISEHKNASQSQKDDLYALGKVLYCSFSGNSPDKFPSISKALTEDEYSRHLNEVVHIACNPDEAKRFKNVAEFVDALEKIISKQNKLSGYLQEKRSEIINYLKKRFKESSEEQVSSLLPYTQLDSRKRSINVLRCIKCDSELHENKCLECAFDIDDYPKDKEKLRNLLKEIIQKADSTAIHRTTGYILGAKWAVTMLHDDEEARKLLDIAQNFKDNSIYEICCIAKTYHFFLNDKAEASRVLANAIKSTTDCYDRGKIARAGMELFKDKDKAKQVLQDSDILASTCLDYIYLAEYYMELMNDKETAKRLLSVAEIFALTKDNLLYIADTHLEFFDDRSEYNRLLKLSKDITLDAFLEHS